MAQTQSSPNVNKSRDWYYKKTATYFNRALKVWVKALKDPNANIRIQAANNIMAKIMPDIKAMEITGSEGQPLAYTVNAGNGFLPPPNTLVEGVIVEDKKEENIPLEARLDNEASDSK